MPDTPNAVLISGGSKGLGLSIAQHCLYAGWRVGTFSRTATPEIRRLVKQYPDALHYFEGDMADPGLADRAVGEMKSRFGGMNALINNAAIAHDGLLATLSPERIVQMVQINVVSSLLLSRACSREFLRLPVTSVKSIVSISSIASLNGFKGLSAYAATKAALLGMTRSLARELGPTKVTVNAVLPGFLATDMSKSLTSEQQEQIARRTPLGRLGTGDDVAPLVTFLIGPGGRFITGQSFIVDGGSSC